jgi:hypothetical protein
MNARQMFVHPEADWHAYDRRSKVRARELAAEEALFPQIEALFAKGWTGEAVMLPRVSGVPGRVLWDVPFMDALRELASAGDDQYIDAPLRIMSAKPEEVAALKAKFQADTFARWMNYYGDDVARVMAADEVQADAYNAGELQ